MAGHLTPDQFDRYGKRALSPAELIAADEHLAACEPCRQQAIDPQKVEAEFAFLRHGLDTESKLEPAHIEYEQLEAYADNEMDGADREIVESHVEFCKMCGDELRDLQEFSASLQTREAALPGYLEPLTIHSSASDQALSKTRSGSIERFWEGVSHFWRYPGYSAAVASAVAIVFAVILFLPSREHVSNTPGALLQSTPSSADQQELQTPAELAALIGKTETLLGSATEGLPLKLSAPVGTFVEDVQPTFRWQPLAGASSYKIAVFDAALNQVANSPALSGTEWKSSVQLERGKIYLWQVTATRNGEKVVAPAPPAPEARFEVLDLSQANALEQLRHEQPNGHLALGRAYANSGVLDEAEREFRLVSSSDADYALAQKFIHDLNTLRHPGD